MQPALIAQIEKVGEAIGVRSFSDRVRYLIQLGLDRHQATRP